MRHNADVYFPIHLNTSGKGIFSEIPDSFLLTVTLYDVTEAPPPT